MQKFVRLSLWAIAFFTLILFTSNIYAANVDLQSPADGESISTNQPKFHWHDDDHADIVRDGAVQISRSPKVNSNGWFADQNAITVKSENPAKTINNITEVYLDLKTENDDKGNPIALAQGRWYWHAMDTYSSTWSGNSVSDWSKVWSFTILEPAKPASISLSVFILKAGVAEVSGSLSDGSSGIAGQEVKIQYLTVDNIWEDITSIKTTADGDYKTDIKITSESCYLRAVFEGNTNYKAGNSEVEIYDIKNIDKSSDLSKKKGDYNKDKKLIVFTIVLAVILLISVVILLAVVSYFIIRSR